MPFGIIGGSSGAVVDVNAASKAANALLYDAAGNPLILKNGVNLAANQAYLPVGGWSDGAGRGFRVDKYGSIRPGAETLLFRDSSETGAVSGTPIAPDLNKWSTAVSGFAVGLPLTTGNQLAATTVTTLNAYSIATTLRQFNKMQGVPLYYRRRGRNVQVSGTISEFGFGAPTTNTAIVPNGAFWRFGSDGTVKPCLSYNNTESLGTDISASLNNANYYTYEIIVDDDNVNFICQDVTTGRSISEQTLQLGSASAKVWAVTHLPVFERVWNSGTPSSAPTILFSDIYVASLDIWSNKPWSQQLGDATQGGAESYPGAFVATNSQNANYANTAAPSAATLSNTAAGYATLGGQFSFATVAGAETDYALFAFQVPAPYTLKVTGIHISSINNGAAVATTATILQWFVANNGSALSLATTGLSRTAIGMQGFQVAAAIGMTTNELDTTFDAPLRTDGGRYFVVGLKMPIGTATASQTIRGVVGIRGYFE